MSKKAWTPFSIGTSNGSMTIELPPLSHDVSAVLDLLENSITLCPRCLHALSPRHVELLKKAVTAISLAPEHLRRLEEKDFYCEDCFE